MMTTDEQKQYHNDVSISSSSGANNKLTNSETQPHHQQSILNDASSPIVASVPPPLSPSSTVMTSSSSSLKKHQHHQPPPPLLYTMSQYHYQLNHNNEMTQSLSFNEILQIFNCAISQEQAWAVIFQTLVEFKHLLDDDQVFMTALETLFLHDDSDDDFNLNSLNLLKDGSVYLDLPTLRPLRQKQQQRRRNGDAKTSTSSTTEKLGEDRIKLEQKILKSLAYIIFDALDFGNTTVSEPSLQSNLSDLLILMSGHSIDELDEEQDSSKNNDSKNDDEGYEHDTTASSSCSDTDSKPTTMSIERALDMCHANVSSEGAEALQYYKAVCRGLFAQAFELKAFLAKVEDSKNILSREGKEPAHYCFEVLDKNDWAKIWMQVMSELRHGIKLRKVNEEVRQQRQRSIEFELTPFEILLDQIRARRYQLKKASMDTTLPHEVKKDARDIILDFIRSRPPLKKSSLRKMPQSSLRPNVSKHELLMNEIRGDENKTRLRKLDFDPYVIRLQRGRFGQMSIDDAHLDEIKREQLLMQQQQQPRKKLQADNKLLLDDLAGSSSDDEDLSDIDMDELRQQPPMANMKTSTTFSSSDFFFSRNNLAYRSMINTSSTGGGGKRRVAPPDSLKSPLSPWREPVENWRTLVNDNSNANEQLNTSTTTRRNLASSFNIFSGFLNRQQQQEQQQQQPRVSNSDDDKDGGGSSSSRLNYLKNGPGYEDFGYVGIQELIKKICNKADLDGHLTLTFDELCHIRNVLTKAELDYLLFDAQLYQDVSKGRLCFSCRKTRFNWLYWGNKCRICQQRVCKKCLRKAQLTNGQVAQVSLHKLCPTRFKESNSNNAMSNSSSSGSDTGTITTISEQSSDSEQKNSSNATAAVNSHSNQQFDICVDCYEMMNGVIVSARDADIFPGTCAAGAATLPEDPQTPTMDIPQRMLTSSSSSSSSFARSNSSIIKQAAAVAELKSPDMLESIQSPIFTARGQQHASTPSSSRNCKIQVPVEVDTFSLSSSTSSSATTGAALKEAAKSLTDEITVNCSDANSTNGEELLINTSSPGGVSSNSRSSTDSTTSSSNTNSNSRANNFKPTINNLTLDLQPVFSGSSKA